MIRVVVMGNDGLKVYRTKAVESATLSEAPSIIFYTEDAGTGWMVVPLADVHIITSEK